MNKPESMTALEEYIQLRDEIGELEGQECTCDPDNFHRCGKCEEEAGLSARLRALANLWSDNWIVMFHEASQAIEAWWDDWDQRYDGQALKDHEVKLLNCAKRAGIL